VTDDAFPASVEQQVESISSTYAVTTDKGFLIWACSRILGIDEEDAYGAAQVGGANDLGLDFGLVSDDGSGQIILAQGKYTDGVERETIRSLLALPEILTDPKALRDRKANREVLSFGRAYRAAVKAGLTPRLLIIHFGTLAAPTKGELKGVVEDYGRDRLKAIYEDRSPVTFGQIPDRIDLVIEKETFFRLEDRPGKPRCFVAKVPLTEIQRLFVRYRAGLLDRNVRLHVGSRTAANKGMSKTLRDPKERENFFYYNNGLCILAERIDKPQPSGENVVIGLHRPQIVNGGQTYYTVGQLDEDDLQGADVLARIICPPAQDPDQFTDDVIRFNNTQTPVTSRDFHSNDPIQKSLFEKFAHFNPPWFYERKEGLWESLDSKFQARFRRIAGKARSCFRIIDSELMGQCRLAWEGEPATPKTGKRKIFEEDTSQGGLYAKVFPAGLDSDASIRETLVAYRLNEEIVREREKWAEAKKTATVEGDDGVLALLERDAFVPFFNFFALASMEYVMTKFFPGKDKAVLLQSVPFSTMYDFVVTVFRVRVQAALQAETTANRPFNLGGWFKSNPNFDTAICQTIDSMIQVLAKEPFG
jgi:hypothetical protein